MNMSSNARRQGPPQKRSSLEGVTTMRNAKTRVFVFLTLVILTAVFSANALTANQTAIGTETATAQQSGYLASSFNSILSYFGFTEAAATTKDEGSLRGCDAAPEGLIACYRADNDTRDAKGAHDGEWVGTYGYATGKVGAGAFSFDGSSRVEVPNAADLNPSNITVDGWVNLSDTNGRFSLVSKGDSYSLQVRGGHVVFISRNAAGVVETVETPSTIKTGEWTHIAATHDGALRRIYVDGKEVVSARQKGLFGGDESGLVLGSTETNSAYFAGLADEVKVFGRALTAEEISAIAGNAPEAINAVALTVTPNTVVEANQVITVQVTRTADANSVNPISVNFSATGGNATGGVSCAVGIDYVFGTPSVSYLANEVGAKTVPLTICADALAEGTETFNVNATIVGSAEPNPASVLVTITDDDVVATSASAPVNEGTAPGAGGTFTFTLDRGAVAGNPGPAFPVNFTMGGTAVFTATADIDYTQTGGTCSPITFSQVTGTGTASFPVNSTAQTCTVVFTATNDDVVENNNTMTMTVAAPIGTGVAASTSITNDDNPWISIAVVGTSTSVGGVNGAQLVEEGTPQAGGSLDYTFTRGLCSAAAPGNPTANCPGFELSALTAGQQANVTYSGSATGSASGAAPADYQFPGGAATANGTVTFGGTSTATTISINPTDDITVEPDETIIATVQAAGGVATNYNVDTTPVGGVPAQAANIANGYINDDDEDVSVTVAGSPTIEGGGPLVYTFLRTADSGGANAVNGIDPRADAITVNFSLGGAPTAATCTDTSDYVLSAGAGTVGATQASCAGTVSIAANDNDGIVNATPTQDAIPENQENVLVTITANGTVYGIGSPNATATNASANGIIQNDDFQVIVTGANPAQTTEDGATNLVYTFYRIGDNAPAITAAFNTSGSANPVTGPDFALLGATTYIPAAIGNSNGTIIIPVGNSTTGPVPPFTNVVAQTAQIQVDPTADTTVEGDENVLVQVDNGVGYTPGNPAQANGVILNDDAEVSVAVAPTAVLEDGLTNLVYTFSRTGGCGAALTVNYTTSGTATAGTDFTGTVAGPTNVVFAAGQCTAQVTVDPTADSAVEPDETVVLTINAATPPNQYTIAAGPANAATGTIQNDDAGVSVTVAPASVAEDAGTPLVYTFTRTGVTNTPLTVTYTVTGTATNGTDYTAIGTSVPFAVGQTTATVNVAPIADSTVEGDETVIITVTDGTGYSATAPTSATGTITNDDATIVCTLAPLSVNENSGTALVYTCTRTGATAPALSIPFTLAGTATFGAGNDYTVTGNVSGVSAAGGTLNFAANSATATINANPLADLVVETDETVIVGFASGVNAGITYTLNPNPTTLTGTITNDDTDVSVSVAPASVTEDGVPNLVYTFTRNTSAALLAQTLTVNYSTTGTATPGTDYTPTPSGTITFAAGSTTATLTIDPTADGIVEPDETVIITITAGAGYTAVAPTSATGTITNDDTSYTLTSGGPVTEPIGNGGPGPVVATFTVTRNGLLTSPGQVDISTIPGSGTAVGGAPNTLCVAGQDYTGDGKTLNFAAGVATQTFTVNICGDLVFELTETFDVQLTNPAGGFIEAPAIVSQTILDDDSAPVLTIGDVSVNENAGTVTVTVTQTGTSAVNTTFSYTTGFTGDTATAGLDYSTTTGSGSIAAGSSSATFTVPIIDDNLAEPTETFVARLTASTNATFTAVTVGNTGSQTDGAGVVTIVDNEPSTTFAIGDVSQIEGNPSAQDPTVASTSAFNFRLVRTGDAQASEVVCVQTVDGDIENPAINPNPATGETSLGVPANADYRALPPTTCVTFTQGGPSAITIPVIVYGDSNFEFDEYFTVRIVSVNGVTDPIGVNNQPRITDRLGLGRILNDDLVANYTIAQTTPAGTTVTEGNSGTTLVTYTVTRSQTAVAGTVDYATAAGTATAGASCGALNSGPDYVTTSGTLSFAIGVATQTFTVAVCGDTADENNETFSVALSNATNGVVGSPSSATTTIVDDDAAPVITVSDVTQCEADSGTQAFVFTITRTGLSNLTSTVTVSTVNGTAVAPTDYVAIPTQTVTFAPGETTKTVTVTVNGDLTFETDESFTLQVTGTSSDVTADPANGGDPIGVGLIQNVCATGDAPPSFSLGPVTQLEGTSTPPGQPGTFYIRLTRTGTTEVPASLTYSTANISGQATGGASCATAGVDYVTVTNAAINFPAAGFTPAVGPPAQGANFIDLPVTVCQDATFETNETFNVTLAAVQFAQVNPAGSPALVTITNDDGLSFRIRSPGPEGAEGNVGPTTFTFTIDRTGDSSVSSTVCYQTVDGTATAGSDYVALAANATNCVVFTSGVTSMNVAVTVNGDTVGEADETFFLRLISATAGTIPTVGTDDRLATINNDDGAPISGGFEGDIVDGNGGPAGDNQVAANDVTAIRNAILNNTTFVTTPNQFQRADVNLPCGNGGIDAGDITVIRQMVLGSVPANTPACGPLAPVVPPVSSDRGSSADVVRVIRGVNTPGTAGMNVTMQFQIDSQGDENTLAFSLGWNPAVLTYVSSAIGAGVPANTQLSTVTTGLAQGRLGVLLDTPNNYVAGTRQILTVTFTVAAGTLPGSYPVSFTSNPLAQFVSGNGGANLTPNTTFENGNVTLTPTAAGVRVSGRVTAANGQGLRNATVILTDSEGNRRQATTSSFGIYTFEDVEAGGTYVINVASRRYRFSARVVNVTDSLTDVNFVGQE